MKKCERDHIHVCEEHINKSDASPTCENQSWWWQCNWQRARYLCQMRASGQWGQWERQQSPAARPMNKSRKEMKSFEFTADTAEKTLNNVRKHFKAKRGFTKKEHCEHPILTPALAQQTQGRMINYNMKEIIKPQKPEDVCSAHDIHRSTW